MSKKRPAVAVVKSDPLFPGLGGAAFEAADRLVRMSLGRVPRKGRWVPRKSRSDQTVREGNFFSHHVPNDITVNLPYKMCFGPNHLQKKNFDTLKRTSNVFSKNPRRYAI